MESLEGFLRRLAEAELWADVSEYLGGIGARYGRSLIENAAEIEKNSTFRLVYWRVFFLHHTHLNLA